MYEYLKKDIRNHLEGEVAGQIMKLWAPGWKSEGIHGPHRGRAIAAFAQWPLPNVWLGTSIENHDYGNLRIPYLLETPAALRFLSCEPMLAAINLDNMDYSQFMLDISKKPRHPYDPHLYYNCLKPTYHMQSGLTLPKVDWVICGGESGANARPMRADWVGGVVNQCRLAGVPVFVKQLGSKYIDEKHGVCGAGVDWDYAALPAGPSYRLKNKKGGDPAEWPMSLQIRETP